MQNKSFVLLSAIAMMLVAGGAMAAEATLTIKNHLFTPSELTLPAGEKINLTVKNEDSTPAEFESDSLKREKVISGNSTAIIKLGPLKPGSYAFMEEFHEKTAKGTITVK